MASLGRELLVPPLAHTGHTLVDLSIFLAPVALVLAWLGFAELRDRRRRREKGGGKPGASRGS
jgi:hypothetical protein